MWMSAKRRSDGPNSPLSMSLDLVEALGDAGLLVIPDTPTAEMLDAGTRAGGVSRETARAVFEAMVDAAP